MISFVLFHKVSEPSMNFNILKLVYWFYHFYEQNNSSVRASLRFLVYMIVFPWRPLLSYNAEFPFATFSGGREHTKANFPFSCLVGYSPVFIVCVTTNK